MRTLVLPVVMVSVALTAVAEETNGPAVRDKMNALMVETFPWSPLPNPMSDPEKPVGLVEAEFDPVVVLDPLIVFGSRHSDEVADALDRQEQEVREEEFSAINGGTIGRVGMLQLGGWGSSDGSWVFLRRNKTQTPRQLKLSQDRLKELWSFKEEHQKYTKKFNESGQSHD